MRKDNLLELRFYPIEEKQYRFKVSTEGSLGEVHYEPTLPFRDDAIPNAVDRRFTVVKILESTKFDKNNFCEDEQAWMVREKLLLPEQDAFHPEYLKILGLKLYEVVGNRIKQVIDAAVADAKRDRTWLHIRLRFPADDPKYLRLTDYPWELLHNDYDFLVHQGVTFSRYIAYRSPRPNLPNVERLNVLLISSVAGDDRMGLKPLPHTERTVIVQALQQAENIQLEHLTPPTWNVLRTWLEERRNRAFPHIIHFDGHGFFGKRCNEPGCRKAATTRATHCECGAPLGEAQGYLVFENSDSTANYVSAKELGELLGNLPRQAQPNLEHGIALVVLSACKSGMSRVSETVFNGVAQKLIGQGIPSVVAMQYSVAVDAASAFAEHFYRSLGEKEPLAIALRRGQSAMGIEGNQWYRPVLYLRWEDNEGGKLFNLLSSPSDSGMQYFPSTGINDPLLKIPVTGDEASEVGFNYTKLQSLLKNKEFGLADLETTDIIFSLARKQKQEQDLLTKGDIMQLPFKDLFTIDKLWRSSSNDKFGFSIQNQIWNGVGGNNCKDDFRYEVLECFIEEVGWSEGKIFLNQKGKKGHLPVGVYLMCEPVVTKDNQNRFSHFRTLKQNWEFQRIQVLRKVANYYIYLIENSDQAKAIINRSKEYERWTIIPCDIRFSGYFYLWELPYLYLLKRFAVDADVSNR